MIDLHTHSRISDGSYTVEELIREAAEKGVTHLALTDHDTTAGVAEAQRLGLSMGITIIPGIEISAYDYKRSRRAHILGLMIDPALEALETLCGPLRLRRHEASMLMAQKLIEAGYPLDWSRIAERTAGGTGVYKQHIMLELIELGLETHIYGPLYRRLFGRGGEGREPGVAYVPLAYIDAFEAIRTIREAGGVPVLAHPGQYGNFEAVPEWVEAGLQGIEAYHPLHQQEHVARAAELARQYGLILSGGSDFHGHYGESWVDLGSFSPGIEAVEALMERAESCRA